jgi:hypothetical protein
MTLDKFKVIWDTQDEAPLFALEKDDLHAAVKDRQRTIRRRALRQDIFEITAAVVTVGFIIGILWAAASPEVARTLGWSKLQRPANGWELTLLALSAAYWIYHAARHFMDRKRRERAGRGFAATLDGDLASAVAETEQQMQAIRRMLRWGVPLCFVTAIVFVAVGFRLMAAPPMLYAAMAAALAAGLGLEYRCGLKSLREDLLPRQQELKSLQAKLAEPGT